VGQGGSSGTAKGGRSGYGVELSGGSQSDLLQVRVVGLGNSIDARDTHRDKDMETIWCGEFERLQTLVAKRGGSLSIESARPVGQFALKTVHDPSATQEADAVNSLPHRLTR
jgi:hypothetical protein